METAIKILHWFSVAITSSYHLDKQCLLIQLKKMRRQISSSRKSIQEIILKLFISVTINNLKKFKYF